MDDKDIDYPLFHTLQKYFHEKGDSSDIALEKARDFMRNYWLIRYPTDGDIARIGKWIDQ